MSSMKLWRATKLFSNIGRMPIAMAKQQYHLEVLSPLLSRGVISPALKDIVLMATTFTNAFYPLS